MSTLLYIEHLTDSDIALLAATSGEATSADSLLSHLRADPEHLEALLQHPAIFSALFHSGEDEALLRASPFLVFAVLVHKAVQDLAQTHFVQEWIGPGRRVPMFEVAGLRQFAADSARRLFLAELLASYTRIASGSVWVQTARGWRRRRFSDLDPMRLIELLEMVPAQERPAIYRRLGDLTLFLTGVFPDYAGRHMMPPSSRRRLEDALKRSDAGATEPVSTDDVSGSFQLLEEIGRRSYRMAWKATEAATGMKGGALADVAEDFGHARRLLNFVTDSYMFPLREQWFPMGGA